MYRKTRITKPCSMKVRVLFNISIGLAGAKYTGADDIKITMLTSMNALPGENGYLLAPPKIDLQKFNAFGWTRDDGDFTHFKVSSIDSKLESPGLFMSVIVIDYVIDTWNVWMEFVSRICLIAIPGTVEVGFLHPEQFGLDTTYQRQLVSTVLAEGEPIFDAIANTIYDDNL